MGPIMQASTQRRSDDIAAQPARAVAVALDDDEPYRYWGLAIIAGCAASWLTIFGAAKLLLAFI